MFRHETAKTRCLLYWIAFLASVHVFAQQTCIDSTIKNRYFFGDDSSVSIIKAFSQPAGHSFLLLKGWAHSSSSFNSILVRKDLSGRIAWTRTFGCGNDSSLILFQLLELSDQSILVLGSIQSSQTPSKVSSRPLLLHLDALGNIIHSWRVDLQEPSSINGFFNCYLKEIGANSIALLVNYTTEDITSQFVIMKLDVPTGNCLWASKFYRNSFFYVDGLETTDQEMIIACSFANNDGSSYKQGVHFMKINALNGSLSAVRSYENLFSNTLPSATRYGVMADIVQGKYSLIYGTSKDNERNKIVKVDFDDNLLLLRTAAVSNINEAYLVRNFSINSKGDFAFCFFNATNINEEGYAVADSDCRLIQQRRMRPDGGSNFSIAFSTNDVNLTDDKRLVVINNVNTGSQVVLQTVGTRIYNKDTNCIGSDFSEMFTEDYSMQASSWTLQQMVTPNSQFIDYNVHVAEAALQYQQSCLSITKYNAGLPDTLVKCNDDTLTLHANPDLIGYNWSPRDFSFKASDSILKVYPPISRPYAVEARTYWGCTVHDTSNIVVNRSPSINLGADTSICNGSFVNLDAGVSFDSYSWNDGLKERFRPARDTGEYIIAATDANGCVSKDTFRLLHLYARPVVNIHQKEVLCSGQSDQIVPGTFFSYEWQDGSRDDSYLVKHTGTYWVKVQDSIGCENSDTVIVKAIVDPPSNFITHDTTMCSFGSIVLKPSTSYASYLWSDGSISTTYEVKKEGKYSLKVTDRNGCVGQEFVVVHQTDCPNALIFPTAFTPNGDGKNDAFRPYARGDIEKYLLTIYDRWGQVVFSTNDTKRSWDGNLGGKQQVGVFVWTCGYQFRGKVAETKKGSFIIVR